MIFLGKKTILLVLFYSDESPEKYLKRFGEQGRVPCGLGRKVYVLERRMSFRAQNRGSQKFFKSSVKKKLSLT